LRQLKDNKEAATREAGRRTKSSLLCLASVFISVLLVLPAWAQVKQETEPNDTREQAQEIRIGDSVEGYFQKDYDHDWYKLTVEKSGKNYFHADLNAVPGMNTYLNLYDAKANSSLRSMTNRKMELNPLSAFPWSRESTTSRSSAGIQQSKKCMS
jgi:signal transduction histidine kinase